MAVKFKRLLNSISLFFQRSLLLMFSALLAVTLLTAAPAWAQISFEQLEQHSTTPLTLTGQFKQTKFLSAFEIELPSRGQFSYKKNQSIIWQTIEPVENELLLTPDSIVNRQGGQELMRLDAQSSPSIAVLSKIFFSVMTADWQRLSDYFSLSGSFIEQGWTAELIPVDESFKTMINKVELSGDSLLEKVVLHEKSGDLTTIHFINLQPVY